MNARHLAVWVAAALMACAALAAETHHITQKKRAFSQSDITINAGDVIEFGNDDEFIHQVYVDTPDFKIDTAESAPGNNIDVTFTKSGDFEVHCHIHPKMLLRVHVR